MRLRLSKSSRLLQHVAFLDLVFLSYSRNKFHTCSIRCDACPSSPSIICVPCYLFTKLLTKAPRKVCICITTEKALVRFTKRIWQLPGAGAEILKRGDGALCRPPWLANKKIEWLCTKVRINEKGPYILVEWSCVNKRNKSKKTVIFGRMVVHKIKEKLNRTIYFGPMVVHKRKNK